ncbi:MAG TPA: hypothetical protein VGE00_10680 [Gammaproteobacteria bacterium]
MGIFKPLLPALFLLGAVAGCGDIETSADDNSGLPGTNPPPVNLTADSVKILDISPSFVEAGFPTDFTVDVEYDLQSDTDGVLDIGFSTTSPTSFNLLTTYSADVVQGNGIYTFTVTGVTPVNWSPDTFKVAVYLSPKPKPSNWTPYASQTAVIEVAPAATFKPSQEKSAVTVSSSSSATCYKAEGVDDFCVRYE